MASQKPSIPKGTRDFSPVEMSRRNFIFETTRRVFKKYGFLPIETPAMENLSTLLGKYGEEGDKLLFRILNSGDFLRGIGNSEVEHASPAALASKITSRGLRYDLTVPFARYVVQHRNEINFPFRRYQIQPVWRADNPQKGRYREFYQCDADMIGSDALVNEFELVKIIDEVFSELGLKVTVRINNRKILAGISEVIGEKEKIVDITVAIDKLEKIGIGKVKEELLSKGISQASLDKLDPVFVMHGDNEQKLDQLESYLASSQTGMQGIAEIRKMLEYLQTDPVSAGVALDITLARGLNYYTGAIIEVKSDEVQIGSICGGGRYDDLTGIFGMPGISGVGISFGADRIYDVLLQLERFPASAEEHTQLLFVNFGEEAVKYILPMLGKLRSAGVRAELYPDQARMKKQMTFANQSGIPFVALVGENEISAQQVTLKNMETGDQQLLGFDTLLTILRSQLS
ncbi:MAG: histidine--tRNA ligase [Bacteroidales bacterium]|nr:histidine--tRNA ligase [Bacteroidales bacterium]MDT8431897.1 histidine--tRNA ligase [Bacteroidales bacterium]